MNWIIDILLTCLLGLLLGSVVFTHFLEQTVKRGYMLVEDKLYKVTEVKDERQI